MTAREIVEEALRRWSSEKLRSIPRWVMEYRTILGNDAIEDREIVKVVAQVVQFAARDEDQLTSTRSDTPQCVKRGVIHLTVPGDRAVKVDGEDVIAHLV
jgi:hypothetical protein